jgi:hypothetical protein
VRGIWITGYTSNTSLTRNLLGLQPLPDRFADLKTTFQVIIRQNSNESPLKALRSLDWQTGSLYRCLTNDQTFHQYLDSRLDIPAEQEKIKKSIRSLLRERQDIALARDARRSKVTRLIPSTSRLKGGMRGADSILCNRSTSCSAAVAPTIRVTSVSVA